MSGWLAEGFLIDESSLDVCQWGTEKNMEAADPSLHSLLTTSKFL